MSERFWSLNLKGVRCRVNWCVTVSSAPDMKRIWAPLQILEGFVASWRACTWQLIVSKLRREIFLYLVSQKGRSSFSSRLGFSLCLLLPSLKGEPVMRSCQPPTQTVYYNQCRLWWREMCASVCVCVCVQVCAILYVRVSKACFAH